MFQNSTSDIYLSDQVVEEHQVDQEKVENKGNQDLPDSQETEDLPDNLEQTENEDHLVNQEDQVQTDDPEPPDNLESEVHLEVVEALGRQVPRDREDHLEKQENEELQGKMDPEDHLVQRVDHLKLQNFGLVKTIQFTQWN